MLVSRKKHRAIRPEINVTPLVDVVLVLLIIFMVVVPQLQNGVSVELPAIHHAERKQFQQAPVIVTVAADGTLYLDQQQVSEAKLLTELRIVHAASSERRVVLRADQSTAYGHVRKLYKACQQIGFAGISMRVNDANPVATNRSNGA